MEDKRIVRARWRENHPDQARICRTASRYKMTPQNLVLLEGEKACAICGDENVKLQIDHDHETGKVRGRLCPRCNTMLGMAKDNINNLLSAILYLENKGVMGGIPQFRNLDGII